MNRILPVGILLESLLIWGLAFSPLCVSKASAQTQSQPPAQPASATGDELLESLKNVSTKFQFREVYSLKEGEPLPGEIGQTRNAFKESLSMTMNNPKGEPVKSERTRQVIYTERPAAISGTNRVTAVVRRFEALRFEPAPEGLDKMNVKPLEGLVVYAVKGQAGEQIVSLQDDRSMTDFEHQVATSIPTLLNFSEMLPTNNLRIGDSWSINRNVARILLGRGQVVSTKLTGTLESLKATEEDPSKYQAKFGISGQVVTDLGTCSINLKYLFEFALANSREDNLVTFGAKEPQTVVTAVGAIRKMSFGQIEVSDVPGTNGGVKQVFDRQLVYERQIGGRQQPLAIPATPPKPTQENSWLVFEDPKNRFLLRHPPVFKPQMEDENTVLFVTAGDIPEFIRLDLDAGSVKPETLRKELEDEWKKEGFQIFAVTEGALNDPAWVNRDVYRVEAALQATDTGSRQRGHFDAYVMQFPQAQTTYLAETMTYSDQSDPFRDLVEEILQTIELQAAAKAPDNSGTQPVPPESK